MPGINFMTAMKMVGSTNVPERIPGLHELPQPRLHSPDSHEGRGDASQEREE